MQNTPRLVPKLRKEDDPKVIGLWKIGRTIGKGMSGTIAFTVLPSPAKSTPRHRACANRPPLKDGSIRSGKDSVQDGAS